MATLSAHPAHAHPRDTCPLGLPPPPPLIPGPVTPGSPAPEAGHAGGRGAHADLALWQPSLRLVALWVGVLARPGSTAQAKPGGRGEDRGSLCLTPLPGLYSPSQPLLRSPPSSPRPGLAPVLLQPLLCPCPALTPLRPQGPGLLRLRGPNTPPVLQPFVIWALAAHPIPGRLDPGALPSATTRGCRGPAERDLPWM